MQLALAWMTFTLWLFLQISACIPSITHSPFLNWNRRSESALIKQPLRNGSIIMSVSSSPLSSQISKLTAGLCVFVCAAVLKAQGADIILSHSTAAFVWGKWPPCTKKSFSVFNSGTLYISPFRTVPERLYWLRFKQIPDSHGSLTAHWSLCVCFFLKRRRFLAFSFRRLREAHNSAVFPYMLCYI